MLKVIKHWFTARNGIDFSLSKLLGGTAGFTMIGKFLTTATPDFISFGIGVTAIMAALVAKYVVEEPNETEKEVSNTAP